MIVNDFTLFSNKLIKRAKLLFFFIYTTNKKSRRYTEIISFLYFCNPNFFQMKKLIFALIALSVVFSSCQSCQKKERIAKPETTKEQNQKIRDVQVSISRYEQALFSLDTHKIVNGVKNLYGKYPENLIANKCWENPQMMNGLKGYISDPIIKEIYNTSQQKFPDMKSYEKELNEAFKIYLTHFPDETVPQIYTLVPGLDYQTPSVFGFEDNLFICLDMYLGSDFKYYAASGMPKFISRRCTPNRISLDCFWKGVVYKHLPEKTLLTLLDNMVYEGKRLYFTHIMFPNTSEQDILGYTEEQYKWAQKYQGQVWQYFIEKKMLYSKDDDIIRRMVEETPFTRDFGNNSPGRLGSYIGLQIVKGYMKNHNDITLKELMDHVKAQDILNQSGYKPNFKN